MKVLNPTMVAGNLIDSARDPPLTSSTSKA